MGRPNLRVVQEVGTKASKWGNTDDDEESLIRHVGLHLNLAPISKKSFAQPVSFFMVFVLG